VIEPMRGANFLIQKDMVQFPMLIFIDALLLMDCGSSVPVFSMRDVVRLIKTRSANRDMRFKC